MSTSRKVHPTTSRTLSTSSSISVYEDKKVDLSQDCANGSKNNHFMSLASITIRRLSQDIISYQLFSFVLSAILVIVTISLNHDAPVHNGGKTWKVFLLGLVIMIPIIFDAFIEFSFQFHIKKDHQWLIQLSFRMLPNVLILTGIISLQNSGLLLFLQYLYFIMTQYYQIQRLSSFTKLTPKHVAIYAVLLSALAILGTCHHLAQNHLIGSSLEILVAFDLTLVSIVFLMTHTIMVWIYDITQQSSIFYHVPSARIIFLLHLVLFFLLTILPIFHLLLSSAHRNIFFPKEFEKNITLEIILMTYFIVSFGLRTYEMRMTLFNMKTELERNRKLSRSISHEIRTPLNTAFMAIELLQDSLKFPNTSSSYMIQYETITEWNDTVGNVREACELALNILNQLLTFDKLSSKMLHLERKLVSILQIVDSNTKLFRMQVTLIILLLSPCVTIKNLCI